MSPILSRRSLLTRTAAASLAFAALARSSALGSPAARPLPALVPDPAGLLDLPDGFSYRVISRTGDRMADGLFTPGAPDGMATFAVPGDLRHCLVVRNHELNPRVTDRGAFGPDHALAKAVPAGAIYDFAPDGRPLLGGTSTFLYDLREGRIVEDHLSLVGTSKNCCGGPTPWGSWLSCEEALEAPGDGGSKWHGFVFEVPATDRGLAEPVPLTTMGRFMHEAVAVDPDSGALYLTQDEGRCLFYRFLPDSRGELRKGGRLQALAVHGHRGADLRNWPVDAEPGWGAGTVRTGAEMLVEWIDLDHVESPDADLHSRGAAAGAALFSRGEGLAVGRDVHGRPEIFFTCTDGGAAQIGQVWRYRPSRFEGRPGESQEPGRLTLVYESSDTALLESCDNLVVSPWGDLFICEDRPVSGRDVRNHLVVLPPGGVPFPFARNMDAANGEFAGACFSPDGSTLFVNIQRPGLTLAVTGAWERLHRLGQDA